MNKIISSLRNDGVLGFFRKLFNYICSNCSYSLEAYFLFKKTLISDLEAHDLPYSVTLLSKPSQEDVEKLMRCWPEYFRYGRDSEKLMYDLKSYFSDGDLCYLIREDDRMIAMTWVGFERNHMRSGMAAKIELKETGAIIHRTYVFEKYRGQKLQIKLRKYIYNHLYRELGIRDIYIYVGVKNFASIKNNFKVTDVRRLIYHLQLNLLGYRVNLFPEYFKESWELCD